MDLIIQRACVVHDPRGRLLLCRLNKAEERFVSYFAVRRLGLRRRISGLAPL
jgi:hypothetical protein